jgi:hypothetical protein
MGLARRAQDPFYHALGSRHRPRDTAIYLALGTHEPQARDGRLVRRRGNPYVWDAAAERVLLEVRALAEVLGSYTAQATAQ